MTCTECTFYHLRTSDDYTEKGSGVPPTYNNVCNAFVGLTTAHGIPHISKTKGALKKVIWSINVLFSLTLFSYMSGVLIMSYLEYNASTVVTLTHNTSMSFPAVTMCNTNPIKSRNVKNDPRLVALLASWGIYVNGTDNGGNTSRKKRDLRDQINEEKVHDNQFRHRSKRSSQGCTNNHCFNGGTCVVSVNGTKCMCSSGYYGDQCQLCKGCKCYACYNGGTCSEDPDWKCNCTSGYGGIQCQSCKDYDQYILTWTSTSHTRLLADGSELYYSDNTTEVKTTRIPCTATILALEVNLTVSNEGNSTSTAAPFVNGFIGSYSNGLYTGMNLFRCISTNPASDNWRLYGFDDSAWTYPKKISQNIAGQIDYISDIDARAYWIGTNDITDMLYCRQTVCPSPDILSITCDDEVQVFTDGNLLVTHGYKSMKKVVLPCNTEVIAYTATDSGGDYGLTASLESGWLSGINPFVCTTNPSNGWKLREYNDSSWTVPIHTTKQLTTVINNNANPNVKVVWLPQGPSEIYCRHVLCTGALIIAVRVDDTVEVYIDGILKGKTADWEEVIQVYASCSSKLVAFKAYNKPKTQGGFLASAEPGDFAYTGDGQFRCTSSSNIAGDSWKYEGYDDSSWDVPRLLTESETKWFQPTEYVSSKARWVWTNGNENDIVCRLNINTETTTTQAAYTAQDLSSNQSTTEITSSNTHQNELPIAMTSTNMPEHTDLSTSVPIFPPNAFMPNLTAKGHKYNLPIYPGLSVELEKYIKGEDLNIVRQKLSKIAEKNEEELTDEFVRREVLFTILSAVDDDVKRSLGYKINEMIYECYMNGLPCKDNDFTWFFDAVHGNCYVFNANWDGKMEQLYMSQRPGPVYGLRISIDVGQYDYLPQIGESAGIVVVVHEPDKMPFPEEEGILAMPGREVHIGIRRIEIQREPDPYGDCRKNGEIDYSENIYVEKYPVAYSSVTCEKTCYQKEVIRKCHCGDPQYPIKGKAFGNNTMPCDIRNITQDDCKYEVVQRYMKNELKCECPNPCQEVTYKHTISSILTPNDLYAKSVEHRMFKRAPFLRNFSTSGYERNVMKLKVYYEKFNYQKIEEYPTYAIFKLFTDINGLIGLWIGCTVFTLMELIELVFDFVTLSIYKKTKKNYWAKTCCHSTEDDFTLPEETASDVVLETRTIYSQPEYYTNDCATDNMSNAETVSSINGDAGIRNREPSVISLTSAKSIGKSKPKDTVRRREKKVQAKKVKVQPLKFDDIPCNKCNVSYW